MKIIFCLASLGSGGAERVVSLLAEKMVEQGHQIQILCLKYNDVYYQTSERITVVFVKQYVKNNISELFWLRRYIKKENPDVVIAFTEGVYCFTICALLGSGIPIIASERLDPSAMSWNRKLLKKLLLPYADWLVVQTQSIKEYFPKKIQKKTSIIYNPVNEEVFKSPDGLHVQGANIASSVQSSNTPMEGGSQERLNRIISVGRLYPQKNQQMMIRAFAEVADEFPDWQLVIYGEGPLRNNLELIIDSLQLRGRVLLPGRTEHVIEELRKSKIFCLSSDYEGMSNAMIEAICVGLPILTTDVSGVSELIKDGKNGSVVAVKDIDSYSIKLRQLLIDCTRRREYGDFNKNLASLFSIDAVVSLWLSLVDQIVKNK